MELNTRHLRTHKSNQIHIKHLFSCWLSCRCNYFVRVGYVDGPGGGALAFTVDDEAAHDTGLRVDVIKEEVQSIQNHPRIGRWWKKVGLKLRSDDRLLNVVATALVLLQPNVMTQIAL